MSQVERCGLRMVYLSKHCFSVNLYFSENGDFFTRYTIDHGLSFDGIKIILSLSESFLILNTVYRRDVLRADGRSVGSAR